MLSRKSTELRGKRTLCLYMVPSVIQKHTEPSLWALGFLSVYCKCQSSGVMGSVSLSWVSRQRGRQEQEMPLIEELSKLSTPFLPTPCHGCRMSSGQQSWKRELSVCSGSSDLIPLMGSKLSLEKAGSCSPLALILPCAPVSLYCSTSSTPVKPTPSTLGSLVGGKSLPRLLAERCSCHRGSLAPGAGQSPPCRCVRSPEMLLLLLLRVPTGWGCANPGRRGAGLEVPCPEKALNAVKFPPHRALTTEPSKRPIKQMMMISWGSCNKQCCQLRMVPLMALQARAQPSLSC